MCNESETELGFHEAIKTHEGAHKRSRGEPSHVPLGDAKAGSPTECFFTERATGFERQTDSRRDLTTGQRSVPVVLVTRKSTHPTE